MSGIVSRIYTTTIEGVITPQEGTATLFRLESDGLLYYMLPDRSTVLVGNGSVPTGYLTNNIIIPTTEAPVTLSSEETELYSIQVAYDTVSNELNFPNLETLESLILQVTALSNITFPELVNCQSVLIRENILVNQVEFPKLETCSIFNITSNNNILTVNVQSLTSCILFSINDEDDLQIITVSPNLDCINFRATNCALNQATVDNILQSLDANNQLNGVVDLSGGTSSAPGAQGIVAAASLAVKGWTVTLNP